MSVETSTARVSESELAEHLGEILERVATGERIIIERGGEDLAVIAPGRPDAESRPDVPLPPATEGSVFDDEFVRNITEFRNEINASRFGEWPD